MLEKEISVDIPVKKLPHGEDLALPSYATMHSAGMDLYAAIPDGQGLLLKPMQRLRIPTGISVALPVGFEVQIRSRSGLAFKHGIVVLNSPGTVDADYRGELAVLLINLGCEQFVIKRGMKIAQFVIAQCAKVNWNIVERLECTGRGEGGFGSTGI